LFLKLLAKVENRKGGFCLPLLKNRGCDPAFRLLPSSQPRICLLETI
jgi:hypothetical protein